MPRLFRPSSLALSLAGALLSACTGDVVSPEAGAKARNGDGTATGSVMFESIGLPAGAHASFVVRGPSGWARRVSERDTLRQLPPGQYMATVDTVNTDRARFSPEHSTQQFTITSDAPLARVRSTFFSSPRGALLVIDVRGLPATTAASLLLSGPSGSSVSIAGSDTIETSTTGVWTLTASTVTSGGHTYVPTPPLQSRTVRSRDAIRLPVSYQLNTGALALVVSGLPAGATPVVAITGPNGFAQTASGTVTLTNLQPGSYTVSAAPVVVGGFTYRVTPAERSVTVDTGLVATAAQISYAAESAPTGSMNLEIAGLPAGEAAAVLVQGPTGFSRTITSSTTLTNLVAGAYVVTPSRVRTTLGWFDAAPASVTLTVPTGGSINGSVSYSARPSALEVATSGLPTGGTATITVTNPSGATFSAPTGGWFSGPAGRWRVTATAVRAGGFTYVPSPSSFDQSTLAGDTLRFPVTYAVATGALAINLSGLPPATNGAVQITGPSGFTRTVTGSETITDLIPGAYVVTASAVTVGGIEFRPTPATRTVTIAASTIAQPAPVTYASQAGELVVAVNGLPTGAAGDVLVTGPNGFDQVVTRTDTLVGIGAGNYSLAARTVRSASSGSFSGTMAAATVSVTAGNRATATATYAAMPAVVVINSNGLPSGSNAALTLTSPAGANSTLTGNSTISPAAAGRWRLAAASVQSGGHTYTPSPAAFDQTVLAGDTLRFPVMYSLATGAIAVSVSGLPSGTNGSVTVTGPSAFSRTLTGTQTLTNLTPGSYTITAQNVTASGITWAPSPATRTVTVTASLAAQPAPITYSSQAGELAVAVNGLPSGAAGDVLVTGPNGFSQVVTRTDTLAGISAGSYTLAARTVRSATAGSFSGTMAAATVNVTAGNRANATATYTAMPAVVIVNSSGLPSGSNAALTLTSPAGANSTLTGNSTISPAAAGRWRLAAASVQSGGHTYTPSPTSFDQTALAGDTLRFPVTYSLSTGAIAVSLSGLPSGTNGNVTVTGPNSFSQTLTSTATITNLTPGSYTVTAASVTRNGISFTPSPTTRTVTVTASLVAQSATVAYTGQFGRLTTTASGLPAGATPTFSLTGTATRTITGSVTTDSLPSGAYTVTANAVTANGTTFTPTPASSSVSITTGATATTSFTYTAPGGGGGGGGGSGPNFSIDGAYLMQAVQRMDGTVPLVAGREALLRVFVRASAANSASPTVRVRLAVGGIEYRSLDINAPAGSVPTTVNEGTLGASWNTVIPAADVRAGMQVSAAFVSAPTGDSDPADNVWPQTGLRALDVRTVPAATIRFVPIRNAADNTTGNVNATNMATIAELARRQHPLNTVNLTLRATFTSSVTGSFQSNDANGAWNNTLFDLEGLRTMEGGGLTHYAGIVATSYSSGVAGLAYVNGRASLTWDKPASVASVFSHELGHNFGRSHAPGCGTSGVDASYPLSSGLTDAFGWNGTNLLNPASTYDHMGYCNPTWPSAYGWTRVMNRRQQFGGMIASSSLMAEGSATGNEESLVIWGGVVGTRAYLNPAVVVQTRAQVPTGGTGTHRLELVDANGATLAGYAFTPQELDHDREAAGFAFAIPRRLLRGEVAEIRLRRGPLVIARQLAAGPIALPRAVGDSLVSPAGARAQLRQESGRTRVEWDDRAYPLAVVRDPRTGTILGFLRQSGGLVESESGALDIDLSNGVGSVRLKVYR